MHVLCRTMSGEVFLWAFNLWSLFVWQIWLDTLTWLYTWSESAGLH